MKLQQYMVGPIGTNCYVLTNDELEGNPTIVVDPGDNGPQLIRKIEEGNMKVEAILLTHGHFDHAGAAAQLAEHFHAPVIAHEKEKMTLEDPTYNLSGGMMGNPETFHADRFVKDEEEMEIAGFKIRVLFTPGHTPGGCCYYLPYQDIVFSGDSLFCGSIGRTDFPGGSMKQLVDAVKAKLMVLPENTLVLPGHDSDTTVGEERVNNYYLV